jgi:hypothetical protein
MQTPFTIPTDFRNTAAPVTDTYTKDNDRQLQGTAVYFESYQLTPNILVSQT